MSTKAIDIIRPALRRIGAINAVEMPNAKQTAVALDCLNGLLDTWSVLPQAAPRPIETVATLPANAATLTIGPGQAVNVVRPDRVDSAYARVDGIDRNVDVVTKQDYDSVDLKTNGTTWPELLWYDQGAPTGLLRFWPVPASNVELHITTRASVAAFLDANASQELPGGYLRALMLALAVEVAPDFALPVPPSLAAAAALAWDAMTTQNLSVPELDTEPGPRSRLGQFISGGF